MPRGDTAARRRDLIARHRQDFAAQWRTAIVLRVKRFSAATASSGNKRCVKYRSSSRPRDLPPEQRSAGCVGADRRAPPSDRVVGAGVMRDLRVDWKSWSIAERVLAIVLVALLAGSLPFMFAIQIGSG